MAACGSCGGTRFREGRCVDCGAVFRSGEASSGAGVRDYTASGFTLRQVSDPPGPEMPALDGFEPTWLAEPKALRKAKQSKPEPDRTDPQIKVAICPSCRVPLEDMNSAFCEACGSKIPRPKSQKIATSKPDARICGDCGVKNPLSRSRCINCAARLGD